MLLRKTSAMLLCLSGMGLLMMGMESSSVAVECEPSEPFGPAECKPAHQVPPREGDTTAFWGCTVSQGDCVPFSSSDCGQVSGFGAAVAGACEWKWDEYHHDGCVDNAHLTLVAMRHHQSACEVFEGSCQCVWIMDTVATGHAQVCDCANHDYPPPPEE